MKLSEFDFELPDDLIALRPARPRSGSRLLVASPEGIEDKMFSDLSEYLNPGDRLVLNDTKVIPARLAGVRERQSDEGLVHARIEVTLLEPTNDGHWRALLKPLRKVRNGEKIDFSPTLSAVLVNRVDGVGLLKFNIEGAEFDAALEQSGAMPLPPYIAAKRRADELDNEDYQTVWARNPGAVAAPTASLHFDKPIIARLKIAGIRFSYVTLHVGAGTFLPVKVDEISEHKMHAERGEISKTAAQEIMQTKQDGGRVIAVGTTALRLLEAACDEGGNIPAWQGKTDIFISPGFEFRLVDALITNFHLPKSTLMMLVSALVGAERIKEIYCHAIAQKYRFFSYGDASLLVPPAKRRRR